MGIIDSGKYVEVHPTFLYESICTFIIFIILAIKSKKRKQKGEITYTYLILYSFARIFIEGIRADSLMLGKIRISQLLSIIIFVISSRNLFKKISKEQSDVVALCSFIIYLFYTIYSFHLRI